MLLNKVFVVCAMGMLMSGALFADIGIANNSFEVPAVGVQSYGAFTYIGPGTVGGWTYGPGGGVAGNGSGFTSGNAPAPDGTQVLFLQGPVATASQGLSGFQNGVQYTLSFYLSTRQNYGDPSQVLNVTLDNQSLFTGLTPALGPGYTLESVSFATGAGSHTLEFAGLDRGVDATLFLDDVSITSAATPEPGLYGILALGLTGLITAVQRRKIS